MAYKVGAGSVCQAGKQSVFGTSVAPTTLVNMTSESIAVSVEKGDEGNLLASKTANQRDLMNISVEGSISTVLRPEFADWLFEVALGIKDENVYTLAAPQNDLPVSTIVLSRGGIVKTYPDMTVRSLSISAAAQDYVKADIDLVGVKELSAGEAGAQTVRSLSYVLPSYRCTHARLVYGAAGTSLDITNWDSCQINSFDIESCTITFDNGVENSPATYCSGLYSGRPIKGLRSVTCEFNIPYSDEMDNFKREYFLAESAPNVALMLAFTTADTNENITIYLPHVNITSADNAVGGTGIIESSFSGEALSIGSDEPVEVTVNHAASNND